MGDLRIELQAPVVKPSPTSHDFVVRSSRLLMFSGNLFCKQYGPMAFLKDQSDQVHSVCFHDKI